MRPRTRVPFAAAVSAALPLCSPPMATSRARAVLARTPALDAGQLRELLDAASGDLERALGARVTQRVELAAAAQQFLAAPDEAAIEADRAWLAASGARIVLASDGEYP